MGITAAVVSDPDAGAAPRAELAEPYGETGDTLVAPAARFDAVWYATVAEDGYDEPATRAFFPLYPLLVKVVSFATGDYIVAGIVVSLVAFFVAMELLYRLTALELGEGVARQAVILTAFAPLAVFFSAVYTEALFLALSVGAFYAARRDRWAWAGIIGGLAAGTRSVGVLLLIPLGILYLQQRPRPRWDAAWLLAIPAGLLAFVAYLGIAEGDALGMFGGQEIADRHLTFPLVGLGEGFVEGVRDAIDAVRIEGVGFGHDADQLPWIAFALVATIGTFTLLPVAYGAWAIVSITLPMSVPLEGGPLTSFGRFVLVVFPFWIWLAAWSMKHGRERVVLAASIVLLTYYTWRFADWSFVG